MQNMSNGKIDPKVKKQMMSEAMKMLRFAVELADAQLKAGRHVVIEHPVGSRMGRKVSTTTSCPLRMLWISFWSMRIVFNIYTSSIKEKDTNCYFYYWFGECFECQTVQRKAWSSGHLGTSQWRQHIESFSDVDTQDVSLYCPTLSKVLFEEG